jgi:ABC-type multidrug transport system fused ATPase/permease subunit
MSGDLALIPLLTKLWAHISTRRRMQLAALAILTLFGTLAELASLGMVLPFLGVLTSPEKVFAHPWSQPVVSGLGLSAPHELLLPLTMLFATAAFVSGATRLALLWGQTRLGNAIGNDLGSTAYRRTLYQPYPVHVARNSSEVLAALMTKINTIVYFIVIPGLTIITSTFIVLTIVMFMLFVDLKLTFMAMLGFGCVYGVVVLTTKRRLAQNGKRVTVSQNRVAQVVQEGLGGIRDVLIDGLQETYSRMYRQADGQLRRALSNIAIMGGAPRPAIEAFGIILIGLLAYVLATRTEGMSSAIPVLGALALAAQRLLPLVQQGYAGWTSIQGARDSLRDVLVLLEQPLPAFSNEPPPNPMPFAEHISLSNVHYRYSPDSTWVLRDVNLEIPRGSRIGFIGTTGSGKSTLLDIIMGLLTPSLGTIRIDGVDVNVNNQRAWHAHIAHVPQVIFLTDATIAENIAFGTRPEEINLNRVREAAERARIADVIESLPNGYDTPVGERGMRLSGGQRQRVGIARALYKQADVIIFDEATSALDSVTERAVMDAINDLSSDSTLLIVAHRITTLQQCDHIVELAGGSIQRVCTYQEMIGPSS